MCNNLIAHSYLTERCPVCLVMPIEVVIEEIVELFSRNDVAATVDHCAAGQFFVEVGVISPVQFVHDHLPDSVRSKIKMKD